MQSRQLNHFLTNLRAFCAGEKVARKLLLAPSRRIGRQWLEAITRSGQPVLNLQMDELRYIIIQEVSPELARQGLTLIRRRQRELLLDRLFTHQRSSKDSYFFPVNAGQGMTQLLGRVIQDLRLAGIASPNQAAFEVETKGSEITALLTAYKTELTRLKLVDYADVLQIAKEMLQSGSVRQLHKTIVLLPEDLAGNFSKLEEDFWSALPEQNRRIIQVDSCKNQEREALTDSRLLCWFANPSAAPAPQGDGSAEIFRAVGEVNEVREVLRRCLAEQIPFEEVEILHTDPQTYPSLIYGIMARLYPDSIDNLPVTFSEGLPAESFHPGRAMRAWLTWIQEGFPQAIFVEMLQDRLLIIPGVSSAGDYFRLAARARTLSIGAGRERYLPTIEQRIKSLEKRITSRQESLEKNPRESAQEKLNQLEREAADLGLIYETARNLLATCPDEKASQEEILAGASKVLAQCACCHGRLDNFTREKFLQDIMEMRDCLAESEGKVYLDAWQWLQELVATARVGGERPRPGHLHVDAIHSGGHSGRGHTFILGLDDSRFPGTGMQDPLLLDAERKRLADSLPTATGRLAGKIENFTNLLARLRGQITLSYC
ncbi:MAG: hypothetical protein JXA52_00775, partial [Planctomycetes bacterium]|nr:hypothetical protein [Planctomycetota bacterium]